MAEADTKLTVEQQLLVSTVADEITATTSIHQQAVVRMLAVATDYNLNPANLIEDLGVEMRSSISRKIPFLVEDLATGMSVEVALARTPGIVPESTAIALAVAQSRGLQKRLSHALLNTADKREAEDTYAEDFDTMDRISLLMQKYFVLFNILTFLMLFIIPQFKAMFDEFEIEIPLSMQLLIEWANLFTMYWFFVPLAFLAIAVYLFVKKPRFLTSYFTRWIPNRWQQPVLTKRAEKDLSAAWILQSSDDLPDTAKRKIVDSGADAEEIVRSKAANRVAPSDAFLTTLTNRKIISKRDAKIASKASSRESAAWMLRKMSQASQSNRRELAVSGVRMLIWFGEFFALFLTGWTAYAIFQSLINIVRGLT